MNSILRKSLPILVLASWVSGCSDSPKQYGNEVPASAQRPSTPDAGGLNAIEKPTAPVEPGSPSSTVNQDELVRKETRENIVYRGGAGGITFQMEFKDAQAKLSKPAYGPDADGWAVYKSGLQIQWRKTDPRTPSQIVLLSDYLGSWDVGGKFGKWKTGEDLSRFFEGDAKGEQFIVELYNHLEDKPAGYSCLVAGICEVSGWETPTQDEIFFFLPKGALQISKDRKNLFAIGLLPGRPKGKLHNDLDLMTGDFDSVSIGLGKTWSEILQVNGVNVETDVNLNSMGKEYDGVYLALTKSDFSPSYKSEPLLTERLRAVSVYGTFENYFRVNGKLIEIRDNAGAIELALVGGAPVDGKKYVRLVEKIAPALQVPFVNAFANLLKGEFTTVGSETLAQITGLHKPNGMKTYRGYVVTYDEAGSKGRIVQFWFSEETRAFSTVSLADVSEEADKVIIPAIVKPYVAVDNKKGEKGKDDQGKDIPIQFAGFQLRDQIELKDVDLGRNEATVLLPGSKANQRASYADTTTFEVSYDGDKREFQTQTAVGFGTLSVRLGLVPIRGQNSKFELTSISAGTMRLTKLCGIEGLDVSTGDESRALMKRVQDAIAAEKKKNPGFVCRYFQINDRRDAGRLAHLYFTDQKLKLSFNERELNLVSVYVRPSEVK